jgi:hypothetical protein
MAKQTEITLKKTNLTVQILDSMESIGATTKASLDDSDFTLVSYAKKNRATTARTKEQGGKNDKGAPQAVTTYKFKDFQQKLIPII